MCSATRSGPVADVAVVGAGVNGLATAHALSRAGHDVVVYEQFELGHTRGSSHGRTRIFRLAYPEAHWVKLAVEALEGWRALEAEANEELLELNGLLELFREGVLAFEQVTPLGELTIRWTGSDAGDIEVDDEYDVALETDDTPAESVTEDHVRRIGAGQGQLADLGVDQAEGSRDDEAGVSRAHRSEIDHRAADITDRHEDISK